MKLILAALFLLTSLSFQSVSLAQDPETYRVRPARNYDGYTERELRRRVWELERAVEQLQDQVFQIAVRNGGNNGTPTYPSATPEPTRWTCRLNSFGRSFYETADTKALALGLIMKRCADATNAVHCRENEVKCDNK